MLKRKNNREKHHRQHKPASPPFHDISTAKWDFLRTVQKRIQDNSFFISFFITGAALLAIILGLPVGYEANDDFAMVTILSGNGGYPSCPDAVFLNPALSHLLAFLYKASPTIPWYGLFLYGALYLGWSLIVSVILRTGKGGGFLLCVPLFSCLFFYQASLITFTAVSLSVAFGAYLCFFEYFIRNESPWKDTRYYFSFLLVCFYLAFLLRWELVVYSAVLSIPLILFIKYEQIKKVLPLFVTFGVVILVHTGINYSIQLEHKSYNEFNKLRGEFHDTAKGEYHDGITPLAAQKVGWILEDYIAFKYLSLIYDNHAFNTRNLKTFLIENDPRKKKDCFLKNIVSKIALRYENNKHVTLLLILSLCSIIAARGPYLRSIDKIVFLKSGLFLLAVVLCILFLMYYRFEIRVFGPLYIYLFSLLTIMMNNNLSTENGVIHKKIIRQTGIIAAVLLVIYASLISFRDITAIMQALKTSEHYKGVVQSSFNLLSEKFPVPYPVVIQMSPSVGMRVETINPLKEHKDFPKIRLFPDGWMINSGYYDSALRSLHIRDGHEFLKWLIDRDDVFLLHETADLEQLKKTVFIWKSYYVRRIIPGRTIDFVPVYDCRDKEGSGLVFFKIKSR